MLYVLNFSGCTFCIAHECNYNPKDDMQLVHVQRGETAGASDRSCNQEAILATFL